MDIDLKSPTGIIKGLGMFLLLLAASRLAVKGLAALVDLALPGKGNFVRAAF